MRLQEAVDLVGLIGVDITRSSENPVIGVAVGGSYEQPIAEVGPTDFAVIAYVERQPDSEAAAARWRRDLKAVCVEAARANDTSLTFDDIRIVEVGDVFRAQAYTGSAHANPPAVNTQKWFKFLRPGIGIANPVGSYPSRLVSGTAGFYVRDDENSVFLVSCNHVIARERREGDPKEPGPEPVIQPASMDLSGSDLDHLATLHELARHFQIAELTAFVPIQADGSSNLTNVVDLAIARLVESDRDDQFLSLLPYCGRILGEAPGYEAGLVYKVGRTTGYTEGNIYEIDATTQTHYDGWTATFTGQLAVRKTVDSTGLTFSEKGDSGGPVLTDTHLLAGLLFAGSPIRSLVNPISAVMSELRGLVGNPTIVL